MPKRKKTVKEFKWLRAILSGKEKRKTTKKVYKLGSRGGSKTRKQKNNTADRMGQQLTARLQDDIDAYYKKQNIDIDWVLKRLVNKVDFSKKEIIQLKAIELIMKNKKMLTDRVEETIDFKNLKIIFPPGVGFQKDVKK